MTGQRAFRLTRTVAVLLTVVVAVTYFVTRPDSSHAEANRPPADAGAYPQRVVDLPMVPFGVSLDTDRVTWLQRQTVNPDEPVRWDPCRPIHWVMNPDGAPRRGLKAVRAAFAKASEVTGFKFIYDGTTDETAPTRGKDRLFQPAQYGNRWAPVLVTWQRKIGPKDKPALGVAGNETVTLDDGTLVYVTGDIRLSASGFRDMSKRSYPMKEAQAVVLHEIAHVLGLGHSNTLTDLMFPGVVVGSPSAQDRIGFYLLADTECRTGF